MTQEELKIALELHKKWLLTEQGGVYFDMSGVDLKQADFSGADLERATFSGADLRHVDFSGANVSEADFIDADLRGADLRRINISCANLTGADLRSADLRWVNTTNTTGLDVICVQLNTSDKNRQIQYYVQLNKVTAGCFMGTLDELKKEVDENHHKNSVIYKRYQIAFNTIEDILKTY